MQDLKTPFTLFDVFTACLGTYCPACGRGGLQMDDIPSHTTSRKSSSTSSSASSSSWKTPKTEFTSPRQTPYRRSSHHQIRTNKQKSKSRSRSPSPPPISSKHSNTLTESRSQLSVASSPLAAQLNAFLHSSSSSSSSSCVSPITTTAAPTTDNTKPKSPSLISEYLKKQRLHKRTLPESNETTSEKRRESCKKASQCQERTADVYKDILLSKIAQSKSKIQSSAPSSNNLASFTEPESLANQELDAIYDGQDD